MPTVTELLRRGLLKDIPERYPSLEKLMTTERNREFDKLCMNRKIFGSMRYGRLGAEGKSQYDRVPDMIRRLKEYQKDKNKEHLVDVANIAEVEFTEGDGVLRPIDDGKHIEEI